MSNSYSVKIQFNTGTKAITATPPSRSVSFGKDRIFFKRAGGSDKWSFATIHFTPSTPIATFTVRPNTIKVVDWNQQPRGSSVQTISYVVGVNFNNTVYYSTDPYILNDPNT